jgi:plastocyanin
MNMFRHRLVVAASALVLVASACGSDKKSDSNDSGNGATTVAAGAPAGLTIQHSSFSAASVKAGEAFTIENKDGVTHTVTDDNGAFDESVPGGSSKPLTIASPGTYKIHCRIHGSMHGTIVVA